MSSPRSILRYRGWVSEEGVSIEGLSVVNVILIQYTVLL